MNRIYFGTATTIVPVSMVLPEIVLMSHVQNLHTRATLVTIPLPEQYFRSLSDPWTDPSSPARARGATCLDTAGGNALSGLELSIKVGPEM